MLRRMVSLVVVLFVEFVFGAVAADAVDPVSCPPGQSSNPQTGVCVIVIGAPGGPGSAGPVGGAGPVGVRGGGAGAPAPQKCVDVNGVELPCTDGNSWWSNGLGCYIALANPQPPPSDPGWAGHTDGAIYNCYNPLVAKWGGTPLSTLWSATSPAGPAALPPDPRVLAQQAIAVMQLRAVTIGIVPENRPGSIGIVGMPTWMWAMAPGPNTWGPITDSATADGSTVTATATVEKVVWAMGDGASVVCSGPGTPYQDGFGKTSSPTCGHTYTRQGTYTVRATSYWAVAWTGLGQSGTIPVDFTQSTTITMGEAQVLIQ